MKKPPSSGLARSHWHLQRIEKLLEKPDIRRDFEGRIEGIARTSKTTEFPETITAHVMTSTDFWRTTRTLSNYNEIFQDGLRRMGLGKGLVDAASRVPRDGKPLVAYEFGSGTGRAFGEASSELRNMGVPVESIAVDVHPFKELLSRSQNGEITRVVRKEAELYKPEKEAGIILDVAGSINYVLPALRREHLLKTIHSLKPGGILLSAFNVFPTSASGVSFVNRRGVVGGLSGKLHDRDVAQRYGESDFVRDRDLIEKKLSRQGFEAKFFKAGDGNEIPHWAFIVHRPLKAKK